MWEERDLRNLNPDFGGSRELRQEYMGQNCSTKKLGAAMSLREEQTATQYRKAPRERRGPYMPVVLTACQEDGFAYEYHHGTIGYGVFTFALAKEFRKAQAARETDVSFTDLSERVNATMETLHYDQVCDVKGPTAVCRGPVLGLPQKKTRSR
jgi:metacaspase-1